MSEGASDGAAQITDETVAHLADLARISLTPEETQGLARDLSTILGHIVRVGEVVTPETPATSHPIPLANVMREDTAVPTLTAEEALSGAPEEAEGKFMVPQILGEE